MEELIEQIITTFKAENSDDANSVWLREALSKLYDDAFIAGQEDVLNQRT